MAELETHNWPAEEDHLWDTWRQESAKPPYTEYRTCLHPNCSAVEKRLCEI